MKPFLVILAAFVAGALLTFALTKEPPSVKEQSLRDPRVCQSLVEEIFLERNRGKRDDPFATKKEEQLTNQLSTKCDGSEWLLEEHRINVCRKDWRSFKEAVAHHSSPMDEETAGVKFYQHDVVRSMESLLADCSEYETEAKAMYQKIELVIKRNAEMFAQYCNNALRDSFSVELNKLTGDPCKRLSKKSP